MSDDSGSRTASSPFAGMPADGTAEFDAFVAYCEAHRDEALAALPWVAAEIAAASGFAAMLRLVQRHGGRRIYLPRSAQASHARLGVELSAAARQRLLERASAAGTIEIPSAWSVVVALRRVAIRAAVRAGGDPGEIARRVGVSEADSPHANDDPAPDPN